MTATEAVDERLETAEEHFEAGRFDAALAEWREALRLEPADADVHYNLGPGLYDSGLPNEAAHHWREAIRLRPASFASHYHLIWALERVRHLAAVSPP